MYYDVCPDCGANLDPGEKCTCRAEIEKYKQQLAAIVEVDKNGQLQLKAG